jgi:hypothetical protein
MPLARVSKERVAQMRSGSRQLRDTPTNLLAALNLVRNEKIPNPESLDSLEMQHVKRVRKIFDDRNIVGIGIAEKETAGKPTGHLSLTFYVRKKLSKGKVNPGNMVPPVVSISGRAAVFTDVFEIGNVRPQINQRQTPISSGFSVGNLSDTGTLGAVVKKGKKYFLLSNSHVLAKSGRGRPGDTIIYPGKADLNGNKAQKVASLASILPFQRTADFVNHVDAALAEVEDNFTDSLDFAVPKVKSPVKTIEPVRGMKVVLRGRSSGDSEGVIKDVHFSIALPYEGVGQIGFIDQVLCTRYSQGGDSGSLIVEKTSGKVLGMHFAGSSAGSVFNPMSEVMKALKFTFANP